MPITGKFKNHYLSVSLFTENNGITNVVIKTIAMDDAKIPMEKADQKGSLNWVIR